MRGQTRSLLVLGTFLMLLGAAGNAFADSFTLTWTGAYGPGNAILTATPDGGGTFTVTGITGTQNGSAISGLSGYGAADNLVFTAGPVVDFFGLAFNVGSTSFNLFDYTLPNNSNTYTECSSAVAGACLNSAELNRGLPVRSLSISRGSSSVPEPSSLLLLGLGLLAAAGFGLKKSL